MSRLEASLKRLAEGHFICPTRFPDEYAALDSQQGREEASQWLGSIGYRLARLGEEGSYFMAHAFIGSEQRAKVREELRTVRDRLDPAVRLLETLRQAQGRMASLQPGDSFRESEITEAILASTMLERRLTELSSINGARAGESSVDRVKRLLSQLANEGYVVESNPQHHVFTVTGKIAYLYELMNFIAENTHHLGEESEEGDGAEQPPLQGLASEDASA